MKDAHIWPSLHDSHFQLPEEPYPAFIILTLDEGEGNRDDLPIAVHTYGGQDLALVLPCEKRAVHAEHWTIVGKRFDTNSE